ncbi:MAG TPA: DUF4367 domain-containing protein [Clostridiales bacterium]|nr:DUF4367 domain-containing protein [Clostridiales bacterium]
MKHNSIMDQNHSLELEKNFLKHIGYEHGNLLCDELDQKEAEWRDLKTPESLDRWFYQFHKKYKRRIQRRKFTSSFIKKAAIILLAFLGIQAMLITTVEAYRFRFFDTIINFTSKFTQIDFVENEPDDMVNLPKDWAGKYYLSYIPEGYQLVNSEFEHGNGYLKYENGLGEVFRFFWISGESTTLRTDSDDKDMKKVMIHDEEAFLLKKDKMINLHWILNQDILTLEATGLRNNEIIKVAEKIKQLK